MSRKNVTIEHANFSGARFLDTVYGQPVIEEQLTSAFLEHSNNIYQYMYSPGSFEEIAIRRWNQKKLNHYINPVNKADLLNAKEKYYTDIYHSLSYFDDMFFVREKFFSKTSPISFTLHCASKPSSLTEMYMKMLLLPFRSFDSLICTSNSAKNVVDNQLHTMAENMNSLFGGDFSYRGRLDVIPLGVNTDFFRPLNKEKMRNKYGISQNDFVILWLGRFSPFDKADLTQLLRVVCRLKKQNVNRKILLLLTGSDNTLYPYVNEINKNARILGIEQNVKIIVDYNIYKRNEIFNIADVFTSPIDNLQETFGMTPIEAMSCGIPQVVSSWDGYKETTVDGVTGFFVPTTWYQYDKGLYDIPKGIGCPVIEEDILYSHYLSAQSVVLDEDAYVKAFQSLIDNPELLHKMSINSRMLAEKKYDWKHIIKQYDMLWDELLDHAIYCQKDEKEMRQKLDILRFNYYEIFKGYPTYICDQDIILSLSDDGRSVYNEGKTLLSNGKLDDIFFDSELYVSILELIAQKGKINLFLLSESIKDYVPDIVKRCAVMLIKRGYLVAEAINE